MRSCSNWNHLHTILMNCKLLITRYLRELEIIVCPCPESIKLFLKKSSFYGAIQKFNSLPNMIESFECKKARYQTTINNVRKINVFKIN